MNARAPAPGLVVGLSATVATFMIAQQIASKAVRDGFFLSAFDVTALPFATLAGAAVSFAAALWLGRFIATFSPAAAVPVLFAGNGLLFLLESAMVPHAPRLVAGALYLHVAAFGGAVVSGFWSVINERFDPYTAKKVMGRIASGATFGGVLGGVLTWIFSDVDPRWLMAGFGVSSMLCAAGVTAIARTEGSARDETKTKSTARLWAGAEVVAREPYPRSIALVVFLVAFTSDSVDYVFKAGAVDASGDGNLVGFFAIFYTATGIVTFLLQALGSKRALKWLGVVPTVGLFPLAAILLLVGALALPSLATLVILRGGAMVLENSLYRSGYELLYTAVPREQKRSAKVLIDLGCDRIGTAAASGVALLVIAVATLDVGRTLLGASMAAALATFGALVIVRREYVSSLASQLRRSLVAEDAAAPTEAIQLANTFVAGADLWDPETTSDPGSTATRSDQRMGRDALLEAVRRRADEKRRDPAMSCSAPLRRAIVSERLLSTPLREELRQGASDDRELVRSAPAIIGQLGDLLLSSRETLEVRLRAAELLAGVPSERAAATFAEVLRAPDLRLRRTGALALLQMCRVAPALRPPRRRLADLAVQELRRPARPLGERSAFEQTSPFLHDARGNELAPSLEIVFLLLAIGGDEEELRLALSAITSEDAGHRGTGLEYLDNLLPGNLRGRLLALAEHPELTQADKGVATNVVRDLADKLRDGALGLGEVRAAYRDARRRQYDQSS
jgi:ATP:ADP antiporter, AAA family